MFGTLFGDTETDADRLKYSYTFNNDITVYGIYEKTAETDAFNGVNDQDNDSYYLGGVYQMEQHTFGFLAQYMSDKTNAAYDAKYAIWNPYFESNLLEGNLHLQGELLFLTGTAQDYGDNSSLQDIDAAGWAWNLEAAYQWGNLGFEAGYAWLQGDNNTSDDSQDYVPGGPGSEWCKVWILAGTDQGLDATATPLGTVGNIAAPGTVTERSGAKLAYISGTHNVNEDLSWTAQVAFGDVESAPTGWSDSLGTEYDFFVNYNIMDNLDYFFVMSYLDAGDFFKKGVSSTFIENDFSLYHELTLSF